MPQTSLILIVDDEPIGRSSLQATLRSEGYRLVSASDGPSALRLAAALVPDLILLDVKMPGMDGYEVCRQLRATGSLAEVPILMLTALDDAPARLAGLAAGADDFISKPFDRVELRARIRTVTRLNRFRRLVQEREKYRILFDRSPCGLLIADGDLLIVEANVIAGDFLDRILAPGAPRSLLRLVPESDALRLRSLLVDAVLVPAATPRAEFRTTTLDGRPCWFELTVSSSPAADIDVYQIAIRDLTAERLLEAERRHAQRMESIGQLTGGIAHDFSNLLAVIDGVSQSLLAGLSQDSPLRAQVLPIHQAVERAAQLTRQLLAVSRKQITQQPDLPVVTLAPGRETPREPSTWGSETILLAEDEDAVRCFARMALEAEGYRVLAASSGEHALRLSRKHQGEIHLLVTDVIMPGQSGLSLAAALRQERPTTRVLYASGSPASEALPSTLSPQESHFLQKPYSTATLLQKLREILDAPGSPDP
jgi:DNA-binding response OmpR family regulator